MGAGNGGGEGGHTSMGSWRWGYPNPGGGRYSHDHFLTSGIHLNLSLSRPRWSTLDRSPSAGPPHPHAPDHPSPRPAWCEGGWEIQASHPSSAAPPARCPSLLLPPGAETRPSRAISALLPGTGTPPPPSQEGCWGPRAAGLHSHRLWGRGWGGKVTPGTQSASIPPAQAPSSEHLLRALPGQANLPPPEDKCPPSGLGPLPPHPSGPTPGTQVLKMTMQGRKSREASGC